MSINDLIDKAVSLSGDNEELSSVLGEIKSSSESIVGKKDELQGKLSGLSGAVKEIGASFGVEKESAKDILADIGRLKGEYDNKINTLSGDKDSVLSKIADLESKVASSAELINTLKSKNEEDAKKLQYNEQKELIVSKLAENGIKDPKSQKIAIAALKDDTGDLLAIENVDNVVSEFAKDNPKLVESSLNSGNGSKVNPTNIQKSVIKMSKTEQAEYFRQKYGLKS